MIGKIAFLNDKFATIAQTDTIENRIKWIMGNLYPMADGNMELTELYKIVKQQIQES